METTKEYSKFQFLHYNRDTNPVSIKKLKTSMGEFGFLVPILLTKDWYVIDGQNRMKAAEDLKLEIQYKVIDAKSNDPRLPYIISRINTTSRTWTSKDFLELYISLENEDYIRFKSFIDQYTLPIGDALAIVSKADKTKGGKHVIDFRNGNLSFDNGRMDKCVEKAEQIKEIRYFDESYDNFHDNPRFVKAVVILVLSKEYEHSKMLNKLSQMKSRIVKCASTRDYIGDLFNIYNHGIKTRLLVA